MYSIQIAGDAQSTLTHFALYGLAGIVQYELNQPVLVSFTSEVDPKAVLETTAGETEVAEAVLHVAKRWSEPGSWAQDTMAYPDKKKSVERSPFSPRIQVIDSRDTWIAHQEFRHRHIDQLEQAGDRLALRLIAGLGEASYWRFQGKDRRPDHGASRWEMKTRNRGEEFIVHRFAPMCSELSSWSSEDILAGITGTQVNDTLGKQKADSRTATGLTTPRATDVALAFCGLVGLGCFPVLHQSTELSVTPAAYPQNVLHTRHMVLPVPAQPITLSRLEAVLVSEALSHASQKYSDERAEDENETLEVTAAQDWLRARGMGALVHFSVLKAGSDSAPERQVLTGRIEAL
ncbi:hypothetical protein [Corynebacterium cystitidis]|uniref:CRISPR-associated protein Csb3 n=1 Tax=Corynebacterium cystitidis DSM 20524 TaxID=1121357 RepID=A0A1H9UL74_9CORY|nr:hypothetical protein [Corynebacterium cystitidis]WJY81024.1 hypothetical protein CCYS_00195 [Corynebacterium cystitidis DSM 20524]SES10290.1 CRISPR-associated protein Csb3 [Corynebacterium cystitidis DSM 20524]SNV90610.1 putative CRISPR-associated protein [Corynebacterium cystitidis]